MKSLLPGFSIILLLLLLAACDVEVKINNGPGTLPQVVRDAWSDVFPMREITAIDISIDGTDTTFTLYSGLQDEDGAMLEFYVKEEGESDHDSYQMTISEFGEVIHVREVTVLAESEFPEALLAAVRAEYPEQELLGMKRILEDDVPSFAVSVLVSETDEEFELEKFRFGLEGELLERSHRTQAKETTISIGYSN